MLWVNLLVWAFHFRSVRVVVGEKIPDANFSRCKRIYTQELVGTQVGKIPCPGGKTTRMVFRARNRIFAT